MGRTISGAAVLAALLLCSCLLASPARASIGDVGDPIRLCIARTIPGTDPVGLLRGGGRFDCSTAQRRLGAGDFRVRSEPLHLASGLRIRTASLWNERADLWILYADGAVARLRGTPNDTTARIQLGAIIEYRLPARDAAVVRLLWDVRGATNLRAVVAGARSATAEQSIASNLAVGTLYAALGGLCLVLLAYNGALWLALRHRFQLAYCGMVAMIAAYAFSSSGALAWACPSIANTDRLRANYLLLSLGAVAAIHFVRCYLGERVFGGWVGRAATAVAALILGSGLLFSVLAPWRAGLLDRLYALSFLGMVVLAVPVLRRAWMLGGREAWLFTLAWALPIVLAVLRTAGDFGLLGWHFWLDHSTAMAMAAEALLSSLAVAYRVLDLARERDAALDGRAAALALADEDPLTGLLNRRAFLARAVGRPGHHVLLLLDVDHFKQVNDAIGHDGGDEVLRVVARALRAAVPADALVARIGGEEFAVLSAEATAPEPRQVLEALRSRPMPFDLTVTASIGSCVGAIATDADWKTLYRGADGALFDAKAGGRDRARRAPSPLPLPTAHAA